MSRRWNHQSPDLPWIGNNAPQESPPGSPSNRPRYRPRPQNPPPPGPHHRNSLPPGPNPRNPPPQAYALPIRTAVPPVVPREAPTAQPRPEDATHRDRRAAAIRSAQEAEQAALEELEHEDEELRARGIQGWSQTKRGPNGELLVRSQQHFGLENGSESPSKIRICITRVKNGKRESKTIALNDLPEPTQPPNDRDTRSIEMLNDVFSASAPHTDTIRIFPNAMGMWCRGENKQWRPQHIFPEKKEKRGDVIAPMSVSEEFLVPGEQTDVRSLTSNGHFIHHNPPPGIGLGWGDWDLYTEWQAHGRSLTPAPGPTTNEEEPRDGLEEVRQPEAVVEDKEVKEVGVEVAKEEEAEVEVAKEEEAEVEAREVGVKMAQVRPIEAGPKEEEIRVEAIEEEETAVEDEATFIKLPRGRCTTTTAPPAYVFASDILGTV
ncbi:hypothetical protein Neosp_002498 [[Neocosmospora] mangrovei]